MYDQLKSQLGNLSHDKELALRAYVTATERYEYAEKQIKQYGAVTRDKKTDKPIPNPYVAVSKQCLEQILKLADTLGINKLNERASDEWHIPNIREYTPQQKEFCKHYARTRKGRDSALQAGYAEKSAAVTASQLLKNEKIRALIEEEVKKLASIDSRTAEDILWDIRELTKQAMEQKDTKLTLECLRLEGRYYGAFGEGNKEKGNNTPEVLPLYTENPYKE